MRRPSLESGRASHPVEDGLTFGSAEELRVYRALKHLQARFPGARHHSHRAAPGIRLRSGNTWSPDVLVTGRGHVLIIETDGPHHRGPRCYVDDRNRDLQWQRCGVPVVRLAVEDLHDDAALATRLQEEIVRHLRRPVISALPLATAAGMIAATLASSLGGGRRRKEMSRN